MGGAASLRLLRDGSFRALWIGQLISVFGDRFTYLALLAVIVERAKDPRNPAAELSWIPVVSFLPAILFGPWIGALVDSWNRKRVVVISDAARGVVALLFLVAVPSGGLPAAFGLIFTLYVANAFFLPARSAVLPEVVPNDRLVEANSLITLAGVAATIAGSLAGGAAIERYGWRAGFTLDALTYFVSALALTRIRISRPALSGAPPHGTSPYRRLFADVREGARIALRSRRALTAIVATGFLWLAGGALHVAAPIVLARRGTGVVAGVGALLAVTAAGMVAGSLLLAARGAARSPWPRVILGLVGPGVALILFARLPTPAVDLGLGFLAGVFVSLLLVTTEAELQEAIAPEARARVFALRDFAARVLVLLSAGVVGLLLARGVLGAERAVEGAGTFLALGGIAFAFVARMGGRDDRGTSHGSGRSG